MLIHLSSRKVELQVRRTVTVSRPALFALAALAAIEAGGRDHATLSQLGEIMGCTRMTARNRIAMCAREGLCEFWERVGENGVRLGNGFRILEAGRDALAAAREEGVLD